MLTRKEHIIALRLLALIMEREPERGSEDGELLDRLATSIESFEKIAYPIGEPTKEEAARFRKGEES